jgi:hypothetical protein
MMIMPMTVRPRHDMRVIGTTDVAMMDRFGREACVH